MTSPLTDRLLGMPNKLSSTEPARRVGRPRAADESESVNQVRLAGRVAGPAITRELPSGDVVTTLQIVVPRPPGVRRPRAPTSDTVDCAVWGAGLRRRAAALVAGTSVEVEGALRRRFWRSPGGGPASRYEVEVSALRRLPAAGPAVRSPRA